MLHYRTAPFYAACFRYSHHHGYTCVRCTRSLAAAFSTRLSLHDLTCSPAFATPCTIAHLGYLPRVHCLCPVPVLTALCAVIVVGYFARWGCAIFTPLRLRRRCSYGSQSIFGASDGAGKTRRRRLHWLRWLCFHTRLRTDGGVTSRHFHRLRTLPACPRPALPGCYSACLCARLPHSRSFSYLHFALPFLLHHSAGKPRWALRTAVIFAS